MHSFLVVVLFNTWATWAWLLKQNFTGQISVLASTRQQSLTTCFSSIWAITVYYLLSDSFSFLAQKLKNHIQRRRKNRIPSQALLFFSRFHFSFHYCFTNPNCSDCFPISWFCNPIISFWDAEFSAFLRQHQSGVLFFYEVKATFGSFFSRGGHGASQRPNSVSLYT